MEVKDYHLEMIVENTGNDKVLYFYNDNPIIINNREYLNSNVAITFPGRGRTHVDAYAENCGEFINRKDELEHSNWSEFKISKKTFKAFMAIYEKERLIMHTV